MFEKKLDHFFAFKLIQNAAWLKAFREIVHKFFQLQIDLNFLSLTLTRLFGRVGKFYQDFFHSLVL